MRHKIALANLVIALVLVSCGTKRSTGLKDPTTTSVGARPSGSPGATSKTGISYIDRYKDIAIAEMHRYGIPASIKLAQAILESGNGNSYLATRANNHFGIKCGGSWPGRSVSRPDDTSNDCFRVYKNAEESFRDHSQFLRRKRYEKLFSLKKDDYKGWAKGLKAAGYATNPRYPQLLVDLIERYNLHQYDRAEQPREIIARVEQVEEVIQEKTEDAPEVENQEIKQPVSMQIYEVTSTDTLASIAKRYDLTVDEIKLLNGLDSESVSVGQLLVVSK
ncbi:MAG: glucosaminidase domain-containing protein [Sphingobacterium sp.]